MSITSQLESVAVSLGGRAQLVAVSKTYPNSAIEEAYLTGQRKFGESRPQELVAKWESLPKDIEWHMIGHLQRNKVRSIMPFVTMIESVDSARLCEMIEVEAARVDRVVDCLLEVHVAREESKTGWDYSELLEYVKGGAFDAMPHVRVRGLMCIASNTDDESVVRGDFERLVQYKNELSQYFAGSDFDTLSMGMSHDYLMAVECGSTSVRVGSLIFGARDYSNVK
ncbi:MAG: YggS family pyridoxal phosphate-dependent enzyme [Rikenellaceae bacterium]